MLIWSAVISNPPVSMRLIKSIKITNDWFFEGLYNTGMTGLVKDEVELDMWICDFCLCVLMVKTLSYISIQVV